MLNLNPITVFIVVIFVWRLIYVNCGNLGFWQIAAKNPNDVFDWMKGKNEWIVLLPDDPLIEKLKNKENLVGPFLLYIPKINSNINVFAEIDMITELQNEYINSFSDNKEEKSFPWISTLALIYPIASMMSITKKGAPFLITLGYGFANLGYLLFFAGVVAGSFRSLGFIYRLPTIIAAITTWFVGVILNNL